LFAITVKLWHICLDDLKSVSFAQNRSFCKIANACWTECVKLLCHFFCLCQPMPISFLVHQRRLIYWKKCIFSHNVLMQTALKMPGIYLLIGSKTLSGLLSCLLFVVSHAAWGVMHNIKLYHYVSKSIHVCRSYSETE